MITITIAVIHILKYWCIVVSHEVPSSDVAALLAHHLDNTPFLLWVKLLTLSILMLYCQYTKVVISRRETLGLLHSKSYFTHTLSLE